MKGLKEFFNMAKEMTQPTDEQIRTRAYFLWEADGCPQGRDWHYWLKAKEELQHRSQPANLTSPAASRKMASSSRTASRRRTGLRTTAFA